MLLFCTIMDYGLRVMGLWGYGILMILFGGVYERRSRNERSFV